MYIYIYTYLYIYIYWYILYICMYLFIFLYANSSTSKTPYGEYHMLPDYWFLLKNIYESDHIYKCIYGKYHLWCPESLGEGMVCWLKECPLRIPLALERLCRAERMPWLYYAYVEGLKECLLWIEVENLTKQMTFVDVDASKPKSMPSPGRPKHM